MRYFRYALFLLLGLLLLRVLLLPMTTGGSGAGTKGTYLLYSDFSKKLENGKFATLSRQVGSSEVYATDEKGKVYRTQTTPGNNALLESAKKQKMVIDIEPTPSPSWLSTWGPVVIPVLLLLLGFWWLQSRSSRSAGSPMQGMRKFQQGHDRLQTMTNPEDNKIRLDDVAGLAQAKREVSEIIDFLKRPENYRKVGARSPRGVLMSGPPGTGKTLLAKAVAGEAQVPFFSVSGSDFVEMFVGVGASRVRKLFEEVQKHVPAILFIDEIDSLARRRGRSGMDNTSEAEQTLNALLVEMDGFSPNSNLVVIAATNRPDVLDPAITRPGRFDREVSLQLPDRAGRLAILSVHAAKVPLSNDVVLDEIAAGTPGFSGADLANLVNESAILAAREKKVLVERSHFHQAKDKIMMGLESSPLTNPQERKVVAFHESGHALVARFLKHTDPVHRITIVPRGRALGLTMQIPKEDSYNHSRERLMDDLAVMMGGRAAEEVALGSVTVGASNDFHRATVMARRMVASWGMFPELGPVSLDGQEGNEWAHVTTWSESLKVEADRAVQKLLKERMEAAVGILKAHRQVLNVVARALLEKETLTGEEFEKLVESAEGESRPAATEQESVIG